ncbi:MAG: hypothetical protein WAZ48_11755 [Lysobacteraceae bacterium]
MAVTLMAVMPIAGVSAGCGRVMTVASDTDCERSKLAGMRGLVEDGRVLEDSAVFDRARDDMSLSALVATLGPASRDIGSGLHIFVWQARDGSTLRASTGGLCDRVLKFERIRR